jgi:hypothetical protein
MDTLPQSEKTQIDRSSFLGISLSFIYPFTASKINNSYRYLISLYFENRMRARTFLVGFSISLVTIDHILPHHFTSRLFGNFLWLVFIKLVKSSSLSRTQLLFIFQWIKLIIVDLNGWNCDRIFRKFSLDFLNDGR